MRSSWRGSGSRARADGIVGADVGHDGDFGHEGHVASNELAEELRYEALISPGTGKSLSPYWRASSFISL
jgi:hypothetical protein